ncbi:SDR family NAD(P)-dependent oxidoreductase [Pseudonocardia abyssalis]|uniref:SDR family oxidoreductase n=1 Tax=Pseudonocardia abyssalis TaxID=2792008 RepID=A0ABS6UXQ4_9PSEU|nr:SDR family oxidoreductase [Pseudonocardia abyssalis]MBW0116653.1 SDR family oxidoreductase [Pseudonocardia abyssalis]MBW0137059.1 SDR family oxidoreductase [Pseudonocardia abyssalis]
MSLDLDGAGVVITGGGAGIGAALARAFAARGARVVVGDLDERAATAVAEQVGGLAVGGDAATADGIDRLLDAAHARLGTIDLYCANAGIAPHGGPDAPEQLWSAAWEVNVMAHVRAAQRLLPSWLDRGQGRFLATVSAAGLLTMLGSAPYSVSKHAALAFAEWLSATYRHRGITVQALCPQGVRTDMLANAEPDEQLIMNEGAIEPETVAELVVDALGDDRFLILPHPEVAEFYRSRASDTDRWIGGMNRLQQKIERAT